MLIGGSLIFKARQFNIMNYYLLITFMRIKNCYLLVYMYCDFRNVRKIQYLPSEIYS